MEIPQKQDASHQTPMGTVWVIVSLNLLVAGGLFFAWHTWSMQQLRTQHDAAIVDLGREENMLIEYLATSTELASAAYDL